MRRCAPLLLLLLLLPVAPARAQWSRDPGAPSVVCTPNQYSSLATDSAVPDGYGGVLFPLQTLGGIFGPADIRVQRVAATGGTSPGWPAGGVVVHSILSSSIGEQRVVADGTGGGIVIWNDGSSGMWRPWAQRVSATGVPQWTAGGVAISGSPTVNEHDLAVCADGAGGAYVAFEYDFSSSDHDIYVTHVLANGTSSTFVAANSTLNETTPCIAADGVGGFYLGFVSVNSDPDLSFQHWSAQGSVTGSASLLMSGSQSNPVAVADGFGAAWFAWRDDRSGSGTTQQRGMRMLPSGPATGNSADGAAFSAANGPNYQTHLAADGRGGVFCTWSSVAGDRICHVDSLGLTGPAWALGRIAEPYALNSEIHATTDGAGGAILAMVDTRAGTESREAYANRLTPGGSLAPLSVEGGRVVIQAQIASAGVVPDGSGGAIVLGVAAGSSLVYAQHLDHYASLGDSRPTGLEARDVRGDQGGAVRLAWNASPMDGDPDWGISNYWIWRQTPATAAQAAIAAGRGAWLGGTGAAAAGRVFQPAAIEGYAWELVTQQPANASAQYSYVASTTTDSLPGYNPYTVYMVEAHSALDVKAFWQSVPDSGYSVDNLPPAAPAPFTGSFTPALTSLQWGANHEGDLAGYRLYRGATTAFVPGPGNLVASPVTTAWWAASAPIGVYKLTAIDAHGNESPVATLVPVGVAGVDDAPPPHALAFALASASPAAGPVRLRFALPHAAPVRIAVYDAAGREVRVLADGAFGEGEWTRAWDGTDARGNLAASGLYFARLVAGGETRTLRFVRAY